MNPDSVDYVEEIPVRSPKLSVWGNIGRTFYNSDTGAILGRTPLQWLQLLTFYSIFYTLLAILFGVGMYAHLRTLNDLIPKWILGESLIGSNPGLGFRPISANVEDGALIAYDPENKTSVAIWTGLLDEFLEPYNSNITHDNVQKCSFNDYPKEGNVCAVDVDKLNPCTGKNLYGYNTTSPCVFIKLNKIYGWEPDYHLSPEAEMPVDLAKFIEKLAKSKRKQIWISCNGEFKEDVKNVELFSYFPSRGIPGYYYPYKNVKNYLSPLIAVHIVNPKPNVLINIECRAWAKNIFYKGGMTQRQGSVRFEIFLKGRK